MSRNIYLLIAAALLASAVAVFCVPGDISSDASGDPEPAPWAPCGEHALSPYGHGMPPAMGAPMMRDAPPQEPPRYVVDAPDRPDNTPERVIDDYGRIYEEKRLLEGQGAEVFVYDPGLESDAGSELARAISAVFDGAIVSERPAGAETVPLSQPSDAHSVTFLELMLEQTGKDAWLGQLLSVMISQFVSSSSESEGVASAPGREDRIQEIPSEVTGEEEDGKDPGFVFYDVIEHTPSSEAYLIEHGFDGGTLF